MMVWASPGTRWLRPGLLMLLAGLAACTPAPAPETLPPQDPAEREAVLALLDSMQQDALHQAFTGLSQRTYTRQTRTEQQAPDGTVLAYRVYSVHHRPEAAAPRATVTLRDSMGTFAFGLFGRVAGTPDLEADLKNPVPLMLPEDPPYLSPRNQEAFRYRQLSDTVLAGRPALRVEVTALPESDQTLRRTRLAIDEATYQLVNLHLERTSPALLFRERSTFDLQIRPAVDRMWVPDYQQTHTRTALLWQTPRVFRTRSTFTDIVPADTSAPMAQR